jgi:hypothetical protein
MRVYIMDMNLVSTIRQAAVKSRLSTYAIAKRSGLPASMAQRFMAGGGLTCETAEKLAKGLGLRIVLEPIGERRVK